MARGTLRIYLGAAAGVGKTCTALREARVSRERGTDVVIGFAETRGRVAAATQLDELEVVPRHTVCYRGVGFEEMDVDAVIERAPAVAVVDDLAHVNAPGSRNARRWQDAEELLAAGIGVIGTLDVQQLASLNDVIERITGSAQHETVPDEFARDADEIQLVEISPEALRRRLAHGDLYPPDQLDAARARYFRPATLGALRELALQWVADRVDESLQDDVRAHGIDQPWDTRERMLVALTGGPGDEALIRRAARMASRQRAVLTGLRVRSPERLVRADPAELDRDRQLLEELGGTYHETMSDDVADALLAVARTERVTQIVLGASRRSRVAELWHGSVVSKVIRAAGPMDVHVISHAPGGGAALPRPPRRPHPALSTRRRVAGFAVVGLGLVGLTVAFRLVGGDTDLSTVLLAYLTLTVAAATVGGIWPGLAAATVGVWVANFFFTQPTGTFAVAEPRVIVDLVVFVAIGATVSVLVDLVARRATQVARARAESRALARLSTSLLEDDDPLPRLVADLRAVFGLRAATLLRHADDGSWHIEAASGGGAPATPDDATDVIPVGDRRVLAIVGDRAPVDDQRLLAVFAAQLAVAVANRDLATQAADALAAAQVNEVRGALLSAVSHDLRTPLANIKTWATTLLATDVEFDATQRQEALQAVVDECDRLNDLVGNLLDMSRVQAGAVPLHVVELPLDEILPGALTVLGTDRHRVHIALPADLPSVAVDPVVLERVLANLLLNAVRHAPPETDVRLHADHIDDAVELRVVDRGPGIATLDRESVFAPFQRLGDGTDAGEGLGLGLAVARGLTRAMGGDVTIEDTPGGGATLVARLRAATDLRHHRRAS